LPDMIFFVKVRPSADSIPDSATFKVAAWLTELFFFMF